LGLAWAPVEVTFLCNWPFPNGTCLGVFSYNNPNGATVGVPIGANNYVEPGPADRGQKALFYPGLNYGAAAFLWNCEAHEQARWVLRSGGGVSAATAPQGLVECPEIPLEGPPIGKRAQRRRD
jgi:hypothetical protein